MRLTAYTDYTLRTLMYLAIQPDRADHHRQDGNDRRCHTELFDIGEQIGQIDHNRRAQDRTHARFAPAHRHRQQEGDGLVEADVVGGHVLLGIGEQRPRQTGKGGTCDEREHLMFVDRDGHAIRRNRAVAQCLEGAAIAGGDNA